LCFVVASYRYFVSSVFPYQSASLVFILLEKDRSEIHRIYKVIEGEVYAGLVLAALGDPTTKDLYGRYGTYQVQNSNSSVSGTYVLALTASTNINLWLMLQVQVLLIIIHFLE
jgi:hypothetical protein